MLYANGNLQRYQTDSTPWQNYVLYGAGGGMSFSFDGPAVQERAALEHQPVCQRAVVGL